MPVGAGLHLMFGGEAVHVQGHRHLQQAVEVDQGLALRHIAKAADVGGLALVFQRIPFADPDAGVVPLVDTRLGQQAVVDIGPDVAVLHVQDRNGALEGTVLLGHRGLIGDGHHLGGQQGPHLLEADGTGGEARAGVGVDVAAVEGVGLLGALEAVGLLVYLAHRLDAEVLRHQGQGAVVRADDVVAAPGLEYHRLAFGADTGVHHADEDGTRGPVLQGLIEAVGGFPDVVGRDLVGQVMERQGAVHPEGDPLHGGDGAILETEVGLEHQGLVGKGTRPHQRESEYEGAGDDTNIHVRAPLKTFGRPDCHSWRSLQPLMPEWGAK